MTVRINKQSINLREKLSELDKPSGLTGEELLRSGTSSEARDALDLEEHLFEEFESTGIDDNATSTAITIDSSENVGIGTGSPNSKLEVSTSTNPNNIGDGAIQVVSSSPMAFTSPSNLNPAINRWGFKLRENSEGTFAIHDYRHSANRMLIDSSGNVGIGTSSPSYKLHVADLGGGGGIALQDNNDAGSTGLHFLNLSGTVVGEVRGLSGNTGMAFNTNGSERMRLDSSGNLLVGTTSTTPWSASSGTSTDNAIALRSDGIFSASAYKSTVNSGNVAILNRTGTDGAIQSFYKNGTTVGSIGTDASRFKIKSNSVALYLENESNKKLVWGNVSGVPYFYPNSDNDTNIGYPTQRFKDAYLSGGVYLGGTGAANKLDDYEEGAWTPILSSAGNTGVTSVTSAVAKYTKVGQNVTLFFHLDFDDIVADVNDWLQIGGLPYAASVYGSTISPNNGTYSTNEYMLENRVSTGVVQVQESTTIMRLLTIFQGSGTLTGRDVISGTVTYQTHS